MPRHNFRNIISWTFGIQLIFSQSTLVRLSLREANKAYISRWLQSSHLWAIFEKQAHAKLITNGSITSQLFQTNLFISKCHLRQWQTALAVDWPYSATLHSLCLDVNSMELKFYKYKDFCIGLYCSLKYFISKR